MVKILTTDVLTKLVTLGEALQLYTHEELKELHLQFYKKVQIIS